MLQTNEQASRSFTVSSSGVYPAMPCYEGIRAIWPSWGLRLLYVSLLGWVVLRTIQGMLYLLSPVTFTLLTRYPHLQRHCAILGLVLTVAGSVLSSFSVAVWHLIATQGVLCAIGNGLLFSPTTLYLDQWFVRRKGLAYGIMWAAKSISGVVLPFVAGVCLDQFGARNTLRAWAVLMVSGALPTYLSCQVAKDSSPRRSWRYHSSNPESRLHPLRPRADSTSASSSTSPSGLSRPATSSRASDTSSQPRTSHRTRQAQLACHKQRGQCWSRYSTRRPCSEGSRWARSATGSP